MITRRAIVLLLPASLYLLSAGPRTEPHPDAPPETTQFAFLIGDWNCTTRFLQPDGKTWAEGSARWIGRYILDGWAIQDDWIGYDAEGGEHHGTNIRSFDVEKRAWDNRWLPAGSLEWKQYDARQEGETMVMIGGRGTDVRGAYVDRNVFYDIEPDHWRWRKDRSYDGGTTWNEGIGHIEATRAGTEPPAPKAQEEATSGGNRDYAPPWVDLEVMPASTTKEEMDAYMEELNRAIGVECVFCHEGTDWVADHPVKTKVRKGLKDLEVWNAKHNPGDEPDLTCGKCHLGKLIPDYMKALERPENHLWGLMYMMSIAGAEDISPEEGMLHVGFHGTIKKPKEKAPRQEESP